jgi:uncharacterized membrane protein YoaK (UPF0700 family)
MRVAPVLVCLLGAVTSLLLLNGQTFTNALVSLALVAVAIGVCAASALSRKAGKVERQRWGLTTLLLAMLAACILARLPDAYRFQRRFDQARQRARSLLPKAIKLGL